MKKLTLTIAALAASLIIRADALSPDAGLNRPSADGFLLRGELFLEQETYGAAVDQLDAAATLDAGKAAHSEELLFFRAIAALKAGDDNAILLLQDFMKRFPASPRFTTANMAAADFHFLRGNYAEALRIYASINTASLAQADADRVEFRTAYVRLLSGDYAAAMTAFNRLARNERFASECDFYRGYIHYAEGRRAEALKLFSRCNRSKAPGNAAPYYIAQIHYLNRDWKQAFDVASAILRKPTYPSLNPEAERVAGEALYNMGRRNEALPYLWRYASACASPAPSAFYILGTSEYDAGHYSEAIGLLQKAIGERSPLAQSAYLYLGQAYSRTGNTNAAMMAYENAYRMNFNRDVAETAFYNFVAAKTEGGRMPFASSVGLLEDFMRQYPDSPYASKIGEALADGYIAENDYEEALRAIDRVKRPSQRLREARQRVVFVIGTRLYARGEMEKALASFDDAAAGRDSRLSLQSTLWKGETLYRLGRYDEAAKAYRHFLRDSQAGDADIPTARFGLGYTMFAKKNYTEAARLLKLYLSEAGSDPATAMQRADAKARVADCLYYGGDIRGALDTYKAAYDTDRRSGDYPLYQAALMKGMLRDHAGKRADLDRMIADYPSSGLIPDALLQKAESFAASGSNSDAIAVYTLLTKEHPSTTQARDAMLQMAITYLNDGNRDKAAATYRKLITDYPTSEQARPAIDDLKRMAADDGRLDEFRKFIDSVDGAPKIDPSEYDATAFSAAEKSWLTDHSTGRLEKYLADYPDGASRAQALFYLASDAARRADHNRALEYATLITENHPHSENAESAMLIKAEAETALGRLSPALATYRSLAASAGTPALLHQARLGAMRTAAAIGNCEATLEAAGWLEAEGISGEEAAETACLKAGAWRDYGSFDKAVENWTKAIGQAPASEFAARSCVEMAQMRLDRGHSDEARKEIDTFLDSNPPYPYWMARGFILLSDILRANGDTFEADEYLKTLRTNYPGNEQDIFRMIDERLK